MYACMSSMYVFLISVTFQETLCAKISVSLLRYSDIIPCDKAFYEAGMACKVSGFNILSYDNDNDNCNVMEFNNYL